MTEDQINARNFHDEMIAFIKVKPKAYVMIRAEYKDAAERPRSEAAKERWWSYLASKGFSRTLAFFESQLKNHIPVMVCCEDPAIFDLQWSRDRRAA